MNKTLLALAAFLLTLSLAAPAALYADDDWFEGSFFGLFADRDHDDDDDDDDEYSRKSSHSSKTKNLTPVTDALYLEECGACHFAFQPEWLPKESWRKLMAGLSDHFGDDASLEQATKEKIEALLFASSAETTEARYPQKFYRSLKGATPLRISEIPYFKHEHDEISAKTLKRESIGSIANCEKCHVSADRGIFSERYIRIPK